MSRPAPLWARCGGVGWVPGPSVRLGGTGVGGRRPLSLSRRPQAAARSSCAYDLPLLSPGGWWLFGWCLRDSGEWWVQRLLSRLLSWRWRWCLVMWHLGSAAGGGVGCPAWAVHAGPCASRWGWGVCQSSGLVTWWGRWVSAVVELAALPVVALGVGRGWSVLDRAWGRWRWRLVLVMWQASRCGWGLSRRVVVAVFFVRGP